MRLNRRRPRARGQALVEFALIFPIFVVALFAIVIAGLFIFYQGQVTNAAREAARYAAVHSATAQCPTDSWLAPNPAAGTIGSYAGCDRPEDGWPRMSGHARRHVFGLPRDAVEIAACWSGYHDAATGGHDALPIVPLPDADPIENDFVPCTIAGLPPHERVASLGCPADTGPGDDTGSSRPENHVTVYACYRWTPPLSGVLIVPAEITIRAVVTEVIQRQQ